MVPEPQVQEQAPGPGQVGADGCDEEQLLPNAVPGGLHGRPAATQRHHSAPGVQPRFPRQRPAAASPAVPERTVPAAGQLHRPAELHGGSGEVPTGRFLRFSSSERSAAASSLQLLTLDNEVFVVEFFFYQPFLQRPIMK